MQLFEHAAWLWDTAYNTAENTYIDFFETFTVDTPADNYVMHISADANYAVYVNGTLINFGQYADYETYKVYDTIPLTGIVPGKNEIKVAHVSLSAIVEIFKYKEKKADSDNRYNYCRNLTDDAHVLLMEDGSAILISADTASYYVP